MRARTHWPGMPEKPMPRFERSMRMSCVSPSVQVASTFSSQLSLLSGSALARYEPLPMSLMTSPSLTARVSVSVPSRALAAKPNARRGPTTPSTSASASATESALPVTTTRTARGAKNFCARGSSFLTCASSAATRWSPAMAVSTEELPGWSSDVSSFLSCTASRAAPFAAMVVARDSSL